MVEQIKLREKGIGIPQTNYLTVKDLAAISKVSFTLGHRLSVVERLKVNSLPLLTATLAML